MCHVPCAYHTFCIASIILLLSVPRGPHLPHTAKMPFHILILSYSMDCCQQPNNCLSAFFCHLYPFIVCMYLFWCKNPINGWLSKLDLSPRTIEINSWNYAHSLCWLICLLRRLLLFFYFCWLSCPLWNWEESEQKYHNNGFVIINDREWLFNELKWLQWRIIDFVSAIFISLIWIKIFTEKREAFVHVPSVFFCFLFVLRC